ncbi:UbiA prenyltransferase family protein [methanogenic archaeon mixed culture ISO4-G1]|nr:UbiA prenyltransferase family protein [methanogenic archaeon mixed culture ISO4-G1]
MADVRPVKAGWRNVFRPWTLHGAIIPVLIGGAVAFQTAELNILSAAIFVMILIGGCLLQSAANILNTYGDFTSGVDTVENETRSPELVTGVLSPKKVLFAGLTCLGVTALLGLIFIWYSGWDVLIYGLLGLLGAGTYTIGLSYKYHGMGQISVFVMMGLLMPLGTNCVLTGEMFSLEVLLLSIPNTFMITGVLAGNEMRDYWEDKKAGARTLIGRMSYEGGMRLYLFEALVSFPILVVLVIIGASPVGCLLALVTLYDARILYNNSKRAPEDAHCNFMLVPLCFKLNWHFGLLLVIGYIFSMDIIPMVI